MVRLPYCPSERLLNLALRRHSICKTYASIFMATQHTPKTARKRFKFSFKTHRKRAPKQEQLPLPESYEQFCAMSQPRAKRNKFRWNDILMAHHIMSMRRRASHKRGNERKAGRMSMAIKGDWNINGVTHIPLVQWHGSLVQRGRKRNKTHGKSLCGMAYPMYLRKVSETRSVPVYGNNPLPRIEHVSLSALGGNPKAIAMNTAFNAGIRHLRNLNSKQRRIMA
jgi:hypothetical protein